MLPVNEFKAYIKQHTLFTQRDKVLLAVSGGKDSVLMTHLFKQAEFNFSIAHCNFNLRGEESQRDETFVHLLAAGFEVPFFLGHFDTKQFAEAQKISTQMAARQLRYQWFEKLRTEEGFDFIALAHHQNDMIETVLINLVRGTGISGLHGIMPKKDKLVRPLLFLTAADIEALITENNIAFVEDSSNQETYYIRNKIRFNIIPQLREINPSLEQTFEQNIRHFAATEMVLQQAVQAIRDQHCAFIPGGLSVALEAIKNLQPQQLLLFELLRPYHFQANIIAEMLDSLSKQSGTSFYSATHRATINRSQLLVTPLEKVQEEVMLWHGAGSLAFGGQQLKMTITGQLPWQFNPAHAYVDPEQLIFPLIVRGWQPGDTFIPLGMKGTKKLSDFFIDNKVPLPAKQHIPLVINGNSELIWVGGMRQDERYKVTAATKKVAIFELENNGT